MTNITITQEQWREAMRGLATERAWGNVNGDALGDLLHEQAQHVTDWDVVNEEWLRDQNVLRDATTRTGYYRSEGDDTRVYGVILDLIDAAREDAEEDEQEDGEAPTQEVAKTIEEEVLAAFEKARPGMIATLHGSQGEEIVSVIAYQIEKWRRGRNTVESTARAFQQFNRRLQREHSWQVSAYTSGSASLRVIQHVLMHAYSNAATGLSTMPPLPPSVQDIRTRMREDSLETDSLDGYYPGRVLADLFTEATQRGEKAAPPNMDARFREVLQGYVHRDHAENWCNEHLANAIHMGNEMYFGIKIPRPDTDGIVDADTLVAWQVSLHPNAGDLQQEAIKHGVAMWVADVRLDPDAVRKEGLTAALRRWVIAFGFTKFTGKAARTLIEVVLTQVFEEQKGRGLTTEEWAEYMARYKTAVAYVSGRHGEINGMCSQLEVACKELGVNPERKPKRSVRFRGSGVVVEVQVETWWDDEDRLQRSAREQWGRMTPEEQSAAIVERLGEYVNWGDMRIAR